MKEALGRLEQTARGSENIMPAVLECVEVYASLGEVCDVLRSIFGVYEENLVV